MGPPRAAGSNPSAARAVLLALLGLAPLHPGCRCQGGDPSDPDAPVDDDTSEAPADDDVTFTDTSPFYADLTGFFLEVAAGEGQEWEGLAIDSQGVIREWTGQPGLHADERYRATLTRAQVGDIAATLAESGFFEIQSEAPGGVACSLTHRLGESGNEVEHPIEDAPPPLSAFYADLADLLEPFGVLVACG